MHFFRPYVARCLFSEGEKEFFVLARIYAYTHTYVHTHLISPYPLFSSQKSARVAPGSLPINFRLETTPFIWSMKNGLVGAINTAFFLPKADKLVVQIFYFQLCFIHSCFEFIKPISCLVALNEPHNLFFESLEGNAQGGGSFGDSLRVFRAELDSSPITDNSNSYHSDFPLSYSPLVIRWPGHPLSKWSKFGHSASPHIGMTFQPLA